MVKKQFVRLNLWRGCFDPSHIRICLAIGVCTNFRTTMIFDLMNAVTADSIRGHRSIWKVLKDEHGLIVHR